VETEVSHSPDVPLFPSSRDTLLEGWLAALPASAPEPGERVMRYMQELSLLSRDYFENPDEYLENDVRACARSLATYLLDGKDKREWIVGYRDGLQASVLRHVRRSPNLVGKIAQFMDAVTDEFWAAYADQLRLKIRIQQRETYNQELRLAKEIQSRLLPKRVPEVPGFDIAGRLIPASEVGGDYWSCKYYEQDGIVTVKLADIAGHGIAAAMLVAAVKFISGGWYRGADTAATVMAHTNRILVRETPADILVTMFYGWIRPEERTIDVVNAGHHPVLFCRGDTIREIAPTGPVLGLMQSTFGEERIALVPGDLVFCCSDGVIEARRQEPFGTERLKEVIRKNRGLPAGEICDAVIHAVTRFAGQPQDDISVIAIRAL
jgi:serine phosphatase RsbU (regulator of sigma subunit)